MRIQKIDNDIIKLLQEIVGIQRRLIKLYEEELKTLYNKNVRK